MFSDKNRQTADSLVETLRFKEAAQELSALIFPDAEFPDGQVVSMQYGRERSVPVTELVLRELARIGILNMDDLAAHLAGDQ